MAAGLRGLGFNLLGEGFMGMIGSGLNGFVVRGLGFQVWGLVFGNSKPKALGLFHCFKLR